jgi:hypothetical protein
MDPQITSGALDEIMTVTMTKNFVTDGTVLLLAIVVFASKTQVYHG